MTKIWIDDTAALFPGAFDFRYQILRRVNERLYVIATFSKPKKSKNASLSGTINEEFRAMKPSELDKDALHCLYMHLLEHNEEHLDCLEHLK